MSDILPVCQWKTSASKIPAQKKGNLSVVKRPAKEGMSLKMDGVFGYKEALFTCPGNEVTVLYEGDKDPATDPEGVWMSDSPMEYYNMAQLAARADAGKVLVGGLGLGILSNMLANREDIQSVTVVEKSPEVIEMVKPYLHPKVKVIEGDFLKKIPDLERKGEKFDTVISDIYRECGEKEKELYEDARNTIDDSFIDAKQLHWCYQEDIEDFELWAFMHR